MYLLVHRKLRILRKKPACSTFLFALHAGVGTYQRKISIIMEKKIEILGNQKTLKTRTALLKSQKQLPESQKEYSFITLREMPNLQGKAAAWFHEKWGVPTQAYLECMMAYLSGETQYGWYLCLDSDNIIGGLGIIENDFHDRKDLTPNVCAVYTEEAYRCQGIAGRLLTMAVDDMRAKGITPIYLVTDHTGFYERYGWEFLCMVQGDGEPELTRMYIHR